MNLLIFKVNTGIWDDGRIGSSRNQCLPGQLVNMQGQFYSTILIFQCPVEHCTASRQEEEAGKLQQIPVNCSPQMVLTIAQPQHAAGSIRVQPLT